MASLFATFNRPKEETVSQVNISTTMDANSTTRDPAALDALRTTFRGPLLQPGDTGYEETRQVWNGLIDRRPALIARCTGAADVIDAVNFARDNGIVVSVRGGGHNVAGAAVCDDGMMIDLSLMRGVRVDPKTRTARAQGGVTWGDLDRETQLFGLATPGGVVSTTGIAGLTLGGGLGWLRSKYGLSCDNLVSVDIVTADGQLRTASAEENPDLFWAVRGGGGNFGIVTSFEYRLHPVGPTVMFCSTMYPLAEANRVLRGWREFMATAPDEVSSLANIWSVPDLEAFPAQLRNQPVSIISALYAGDADEGERVMQPLRELATPLLDLSGQIPFTTAQTVFDPFFPKGQRYYYFKSTSLNNLNDEVVNAIIAIGHDRPLPSLLMAIWHYSGAMCRVGEQESAFTGRNTPFLLSIDSIWDDPLDSERIIAWSREQIAAMQPYSSGGMYVNFPGFGEGGEAQVRSAYGANYERLVEVKTKYDPNNLFQINQNIKPRTP
jgi:FAD/FMN-containing dehydrogenase